MRYFLMLLPVLLLTSQTIAQTDDARIERIHEKIQQLSAELEFLRAQQDPILPEPIDGQPVDRSVLQREPINQMNNDSNGVPYPMPSPGWEQATSSRPVIGHQYNSEPLATPVNPYGPYGFAGTSIRTPLHPGHAVPYFQPNVTQPLYVDPGFAGRIGPGYAPGYVNGFPPSFGGTRVFVGPGGFGIDFGGLQLNFRGGNQGGGRGHGKRR